MTTPRWMRFAGLIVVMLCIGTPSSAQERQQTRQDRIMPDQNPTRAFISGNQKDDSASGGGSGQHGESAADVPIYRPPLRGAPGGRVAGGTRGAEHEALLLSVLSPEHTGFSIHEQPVLYWYVAEVLAYPIEFTLIDAQSIQPLVEIQFPPPSQAGMQRVRLADHRIRLAPDTLYQWFVAIVVDPDRRSKDLVTGATIMRATPSNALRERLIDADRMQKPYVYADAGLWYDAVMAISELLEATPRHQAFRRQRAALLEGGCVATEEAPG